MLSMNQRCLKNGLISMFLEAMSSTRCNRLQDFLINYKVLKQATKLYST